MLKLIYNWKGDTLLRTEWGEPPCGAYCDRCGDCLACYSESTCYAETEEPDHTWIEYEPYSPLVEEGEGGKE